VDLRTWILADHTALADRFDRAVAAHVPLDRWREHADGGGSSIAFLVFHCAWHEDLAVTTAVRGRPPLLLTWRPPLGLIGAALHEGLGEGEPHHLTADLHLASLVDYARAVHHQTREWLAHADLVVLDQVPPAGERIDRLAGVEAGVVPWLHAQWAGKTVGWFVQWEAIGHRQGHLGEMISVRNRLGLSPF
jgi:hypothetical protein